MARSLAVIGLIISSLVSFGASALTIGDIELDSALNQPFSAGVALTANSAEELDTLQVDLASQKAFNDYGLDRPGYLSDIRFKVVRKSATSAELRMEGVQTVVEPFVTLLVRFNWSAGNLLREYTVLLDPPIFDTAAPAAEVEQAQSAPAETAQEITREETAAPAAASVAAPRSVAEPAPASRPAPRRASFDGDAYGPIATGSSLWNIANRLREGTGLTTNQMMIALYRANPQAFMGNINRLKAGSIVRMPEAAAMESISEAEANSEVISQDRAWKSGETYASSSEPAQLKLMPPSESFDGQTGGDGVASAGDSGMSGGSDSGDSAALRDELEETRRLLAVKDQELVELQERIASMEDSAATELTESDVVAESVAGVEPSDAEAISEDAADTEAMADAMGDSGVDTPADASSEDQSQVADTAAAKPADSGMPAASSTNVVSSESAESGSLMDTVMGVLTSIWLWIAIGVLVVIGLVFFRRKKPAPAISSALLDDEAEDEPLESFESPDSMDDDGVPSGPIASPVPDGYERDPAIDSMVVEEGMSEDFLKAPADAETSGEVTAEIPAIDEAASDDDSFEVAPPDDFDIGLDTIGSDNQEDLLGFDSEEEGLEKTAEITPEGVVDHTATIGSETAINLDHTDPIAEADFHMAYGLYDQAAELLEKALEDDPEDKMLRVKLLEVYFVWEKKDGFVDEAVKLRAAVSDDADPEWNKVVIMGQQIAPDHELFSSAGGAAGAQILDVQVGGDGDELDMDFGFDESNDEPEVDLNFDPGNTSIGLGDNNDTLDFDVGSVDSPTMESPTLEALGADSPTMESPTIEAAGSEEPTMETPTIEFPGSESPTMETPTLESPVITESAEEDSIDLGDLGDLDIDLGGLDDTGDESESTQSDIGSSFDDISFDSEEQTEEDIGVADIGDEDATMLAGNIDLAIDEAIAADSAGDESSEDIADDDPTMLAGDVDISEFIKNDLEAEGAAGDGTLDMPVAGDTVEQPALVDAGDTVEQPSISEASEDPDSLNFSDDVFGGGSDADDIHAETHAIDALDSLDDVGLDDAEGGVDTKLNLAQAYIDMGDADGARSILDEVVEEGDESEQAKAKDLIEKLAG